MRWAVTTAALLALAAIVAGIAMFSRYRARSTLAAPEKSVAVLPLENLSEEKENAYFADGIQDELLSNLARIKDLKVISRTSVMQYKSGITRNLKEIAQQLGVSNVVEGSVRRSGNRIRVSVQLIDAQTDVTSGCRTMIAHWPIRLLCRASWPRRLLGLSGRRSVHKKRRAWKRSRRTMPPLMTPICVAAHLQLARV